MIADSVLRVRMTAAMRAELAELADGAGVTSSHLVRSAIRIVRVAGPRRLVDTLDSVAALRRELHAIGNNLNQVARRLNGGAGVDPVEVRRVLDEVAAAAAAANAALRIG